MIFNEVGKSIFGKLTSKNGQPLRHRARGHGRLRSGHQRAHHGGHLSITLGLMGERQQFKDAEGLAIVLVGALPAPVIIAQDRTVGALGEDSISAGRAAITIGGIAVIIFMMIYYSFAGFVQHRLGAQLGLHHGRAGTARQRPSGHRGMVLTVGMAVDANVIIFERTREEPDG